MILILLFFWSFIGIGAGIHITLSANPLTEKAFENEYRISFGMFITLLGIVVGPFNWIYILKKTNGELERMKHSKYLTEKESNVLEYLEIKRDVG